MSSSYKRTLSEFVQVEPAGCHLPKDIRCNRKMDPSVKMVLLEMAIESSGCGVVLASDGFLATNTGLSRGTVIKSREALERAGLIEKVGPPVRQVYRYRFLHPQMLGSNSADPQVKTKRKDPASNTAPRCPACGAAREVGKTGICIVCSKQDQADTEVSRFLNAEPWTTKEDTWTKFRSRSRGTRYSNRQIETAWSKWNISRRKMESA